MRLALTALAALTMSSAVAAAEVQSMTRIPAVDKSTQSEDIRFENEAGERMTVPVQLSGSGPFQFIVDTGADRTVISRELATRLGLKSGADASVHTVTGVSRVATVDVPHLAMTGKPMHVDDAPLLEGAHIGADGMLGVDSLRSQRVTFDFDKQTLTVVPSAVREARDVPGTIVVRASRKNGRLVLAEAEANGRGITVVVDTGAQMTIGNEALRQQMVRRGLVNTMQTIELVSVTGETIVGNYMYLKELKIGGAKLSNLAVVFADAHTFRRLNLDRRPALLLGMNAIRAFKKVSIDFAARKFKVVLPESTQVLDTRWASAS